MLDDSQLAQLIHQMPENNGSFLNLLQAAGPSPIKSVTSSFDCGNFNFEFLNNADFGLNGDSTAATILDVVNLDISQPNPITNQQPLVATKSTGAPQKHNSKGKLECMAYGCTKFVLAAKCKSKMCKRHCVTNGGCQDHSTQSNNNDSSPSLENSAQIPVALAGDNPWALLRPPSAIPLQPITSPATNHTIFYSNLPQTHQPGESVSN